MLSRFQEERDRMCGLGVLLWSLLCEAGLEEGERGQGAMGEAAAVTLEARIWVTSPRAATGAGERCGPTADMLEGRTTRTSCVYVSLSVVSDSL